MTHTTRQIAGAVGVAPSTFALWARDWHGPAGSGHTRRLGPVDVRVAHAWRTLHGAIAPHHAAAVRRLVAAAVRCRPEGRWVAYSLADGWAATFDTLDDVVATWTTQGLRCVTVIDLGHAPQNGEAR